jgi:hypothetical protein
MLKLMKAVHLHGQLPPWVPLSILRNEA